MFMSNVFCDFHSRSILFQRFYLYIYMAFCCVHVFLSLSPHRSLVNGEPLNITAYKNCVCMIVPRIRCSVPIFKSNTAQNSLFTRRLSDCIVDTTLYIIHMTRWALSTEQFKIIYSCSICLFSYSVLKVKEQYFFFVWIHRQTEVRTDKTTAHDTFRVNMSRQWLPPHIPKTPDSNSTRDLNANSSDANEKEVPSKSQMIWMKRHFMCIFKRPELRHILIKLSATANHWLHHNDKQYVLLLFTEIKACVY